MEVQFQRAHESILNQRSLMKSTEETTTSDGLNKLFVSALVLANLASAIPVLVTVYY